MKKLIPIIYILLLLLNCSPRYKPYMDSSNEYKDKYADQLEQGSTLIRAYYHYTIEKTTTGEYVHKIYYPDTRQITNYDTYTDPDLRVKNGLSKTWTDDGMLTSEGIYKNDRKEGTWKTFSESFVSLTTFSGNYTNGNMEGVWTTRDSIGNVLSEYSYQGSKRNGLFKVWDVEGNLVEEGNYKDGKLDWNKKYIEESFKYNDSDVETIKEIEKQPLFPGCTLMETDQLKKCADEKMLQFIYSNIRYPAKAREYGIEGMAIVKFVVEKNGKITNIKSVRGICNEIRDEVIRVVQLMPDWIPGEQRGNPVRVQFSLPVKFKLE